MAEDRRTPFRYAQFCSVARAAEILGHRWTLLVLRELFLGPARNVQIFWADLFGVREIYNRPGVVGPENWCLRVPERFAALDDVPGLGTAIAWVLVRDQFRGKQLLEVVIDIPFALPTIVAGLVLLSLYGPSSPLGVNWANTRVAVFLAFLFVTLPFIVRTVQPVLLELEHEVEEAAASLGASRLTAFRLVILPSLAPAITSGAALSFCRAISEYGSLVLLSGNLPYATEVASVRIMSSVEGDKLTEAAAVASILLVVALIVILVLDLISPRVARYA